MTNRENRIVWAGPRARVFLDALEDALERGNAEERLRDGLRAGLASLEPREVQRIMQEETYFFFEEEPISAAAPPATPER
jgi:hypothetical protein